MALDFSTLTPDELRQLAKAIQSSQLLEQQNEIDKQQGERLHNEKNAPWAPGGYYEKALKDVPPYQFREYPKMLYSTEYPSAQRDYAAALHYRERRDEPGTRDDMIRRATIALRESTRVVKSQAEEKQALETGLWAHTATLAAEAEERRQQAIAEAAAVARHDDRRLSGAALAEREAAENAAEGHLVEVPEKRKGR